MCALESERQALDEKMTRLRDIESLLVSEDKSEGIRRLADEMMALVDGDDALRAPRGAYSYHLVVAAQAAWSAGDIPLAREYTERALAAVKEYGGPDDAHVDVLRQVLKMM